MAISITKELVDQYLQYEPDTGDFYWIAEPNSRGPKKIGTKAGCEDANGYIIIGFFGHKLYGHRLAWLLTYGYMLGDIDHKNTMRWDNRLDNLREATHAQNIAAIHSDAKGYEVHGAKYRTRININGVRIELGSYNNPEEATAAYQAARVEFLGEFA